MIKTVLTKLKAMASLENPSTSLANPAAWLTALFGGGVDGVSRDSALRLSAVYGCVSIIADSVAMLPFHVYERTKTGRSRAPDHPLYPMLHLQPHPQFAAFTAKQLMMCHLLLAGAAFMQIYRTRGSVVALVPLMPDSVEVRQVPGGLAYWVQGQDGVRREVDQQNMIHVPGLGFDGVNSFSPITHHGREVLGLSQDMQRGAKVWAKGGGRPPGVIEVEKGLNPEGMANLKRTFAEGYAGADKAADTLILDAGMKWKQMSVSPTDMQLLEARRFQVQEIARIFRVPLHMIGEQTKDTAWGSGIEQQTLGFVTFTIAPWLIRIEQEINRKLFYGGSDFYAEHDTKGLMLADSQARAAFYSSGIQNGYLTPNEARASENMDSVPGGDQTYIPVNLAAQGAKRT